MKRACLNCVQMSEDHTAANIAEVQLELLNEWEIAADKRVSMTTDCGANMVKAVQDEMDGSMNHISCFGHTMNTAVSKAFELAEIQDILGKVKDIQKLFAHSYKACRDLEGFQQHYKLPKHKIPSYSKTRWWSLLRLIKIVVEQHLALISFLQQFQKGKYKHLILCQTEVDVLENVIAVLKPIEAVSENMSGEHFVTASCILPLYFKLKEIMHDGIDPDETCIDNSANDIKLHFMTGILRYMCLRYIQKKEAHKFLSKCAFIYPRFKLKYVAEEEHSAIIGYINEEIDNISCDDSSPSVAFKKYKCGSGLGAIFNSTRNKENVVPENEVQQYLKENIIGIDENPLYWWKLNKNQFPKLSRLELKYLCSTGTSVPSVMPEK